MKTRYIKFTIIIAALILLFSFPALALSSLDNHTNVAINSTNFPDKNFRQFVLDNYDKSIPKDNMLSEEEIAAVDSIDIQSKDVTTLDGISFFTSLKSLNCSTNSIENLDLSKNVELEHLECYSNKLTRLRLSQNKKLNFLDCCQNDLNELNLSINLVVLCCHDNRLSDLDVQNNPALSHLECHNNFIDSLDLNNNLELAYLNCSNNKLKKLNVSNNIKLSYLNCEDNLLSSLDTNSNILLPIEEEQIPGNSTDKYLGGNQIISVPTSKMFWNHKLRLTDLVDSENLKNIENVMLNGNKIEINDTVKIDNNLINLGNITENENSLTYDYLTSNNTRRYIHVTVNLHKEQGINLFSLLSVFLLSISLSIFLIILFSRKHAKKNR